MYIFMINIFKSALCVDKRGGLTFPHEGTFAVVHYLFCNQAVIDHLVDFHAAKAAVLHAAVHLILHQGAPQVGAHLLDGATQVLDTTHNRKH